MSLRPTVQTHLWLIMLLLAACTHMSSPVKQAAWQAPDDGMVAGFDSEGRLAVKEGDKGSYANFAWQDLGLVQSIHVNTPLGNTVGVLCRDAQGVIAQGSDGQTHHAASVEALSQQLLGFTLPMSHLNQWAQGRWAEGVPHHILPDGRLRQLGWLISRQTQADGNTPRILVLENPQLNIRLVFDYFEPVDLRVVKIGRCSLRQQGHQDG